MAVDEIVVRAELKDDLSRPLRHVGNEVDRFERRVDQVGKTSLRASRGFTDLGRQVQGLDRVLRTSATSLGQLAAQATRASSIGLGTLGVAATAFGLKSEASFERSRIAFGTLLESVEGGNRLFADLQQFNLKTPFELNEISAATQTLLQFGVAGGNVLPTLKSISDIAATTSAPGENLNRIALALGQISSAGVLRGQDLNQLVQAGFPAYQLLTQITGQTTQQLREQMETGLTLPAEEFIAALNEGGGVLAKFASGAEAQSRTLSGVFSNLKETVQTQLGAAFAPLAQGLSGTLPAFSQQLGGFISDVAPPLSRLGLILVDSVGRLLPVIDPPLTALLTGLGTLAQATTPAFAALEPIMAEVGTALGEVVASILPLMPDLVGAFVSIVALLPDMLSLTAQLIPILQPVLQLVEMMASTLGWVLDKLSSVAGPVLGPLAALLGAAPGGTDVDSLAAYNQSRLPGGGLALGTTVLPSIAAPAAAGAFGTPRPVGQPFAMQPAAPVAPMGGGTATVNMTVTVNHPTSNVDVSKAVADGFRQEWQRVYRRQDPDANGNYHPQR
jgi:tape measure domain-containing protein